MKKKQLSISVLLSFLTHFLIFAGLFFLVYFVRKEISYFESGGGNEAVWIDLESANKGFAENNSLVVTSSPKKNDEAEAKLKKTPKNDAILVRQNIEKKVSSEQNGSHNSGEEKKAAGAGSSQSGQGMGQGSGLGTGEGAGSGSASPSVLGLIRKKIEQAKRYPVLARARKIEGVAILSFSINPSGGVEALSLVKSSDSDILDQEALATVKRASPFPYYSQPIRISIKFNLD